MWQTTKHIFLKERKKMIELIFLSSTSSLSGVKHILQFHYGH